MKDKYKITLTHQITEEDGIVLKADDPEIWEVSFDSGLGLYQKSNVVMQLFYKAEQETLKRFSEKGE